MHDEYGERDASCLPLSEHYSFYPQRRLACASTLEGKLQKPEFGNYVDHDSLFSGEHADLPGFTHDRRWLISEYIFNAKFQRILQNDTNAKRGASRSALRAHSCTRRSVWAAS